MTAKEMQEALHNGTRLYGSLITSSSPKTLQEIHKTNLDFVFIDNEHMSMDREKVSFMCRGFAEAGLPSILRIPEPDPFLAAMAIDAGASGVMAPYLESEQQVLDLYGAVKLRPLKGARLRAALEGEPLDRVTAEYLADYNKGKMIFLNIESTRAMEKLGTLVRMKGVDGVIIGPHDLSISLGVPEQWDAPVFVNAVTEIIQKSRAAGIGAGIHYSYGVPAMTKWAQDGMNIVLYSSDISLFIEGINKSIDEIKNGLGKGAAQTQPVTVNI